VLSSENEASSYVRAHVGTVALGHSVDIKLRAWLVVCWFLYPI
jgi:hypothetical protein